MTGPLCAGVLQRCESREGIGDRIVHRRGTGFQSHHRNIEIARLFDQAGTGYAEEHGSPQSTLDE
jgi:hypothetical protein